MTERKWRRGASLWRGRELGPHIYGWEWLEWVLTLADIGGRNVVTQGRIMAVQVAIPVPSPRSYSGLGL